MRNVDEEIQRLSLSYRTELRTLQSQLDMKNALLDSYKQRLSEMEVTIIRFEEDLRSQKRFENELKEQHDEKLKVTKNKKHHLFIKISQPLLYHDAIEMIHYF